MHHRKRQARRSKNQLAAESTSPPSGHRVIPGYYYKKDINRYFKIPEPGQPEYDQYKQWLKQDAEENRQGEIPSCEPGITQKRVCTMSSIIQSQTLGQVSKNSFRRQIQRKLINRLSNEKRIEVASPLLDCTDIHLDPCYCRTLLCGSTNGFLGA
eukprot:TRINITY_DN6945_c2_g1_i4.p1 TRINITY_DN6945_c2_g1~~TRINITY_DN6945_c2_g1_i4.p1  ORF type:complete len:155 (-),score=24.93 TRINITY_DN6945_c2_g1_i4:84-548(-)